MTYMDDWWYLMDIMLGIEIGGWSSDEIIDTEYVEEFAGRLSAKDWKIQQI